MSQKTPTPILRQLAIEELRTELLKPNPRNVRKRAAKQITKLCRAFKAFGFTSPIAVDEDLMILAGHGRWEAAKRCEMATVPCVRLTGLTPEQKIAFAIADNKIGDESEFDKKGLDALLRELAAVSFDLELTGFDMGEIDFRIDGAAGEMMGDPDDAFDGPGNQAAITRLGEVWRLGPHRIVCGSSLEAATYRRVLGDRRVQAVFADAPFNIAVAEISGLGKVKHREFAMAVGEMSDDEFERFLATYMRLCAEFSDNGSIHFHCMDWRQIRLLLQAGHGTYSELKNLCIWRKSNAGMGSLYRSQHELVAVFKNGTNPHCNNVELGKHGRYRSNIWEYAGANSFGKTRQNDLTLHPTVKPTALVADAIRDVTKRGDLVLDPFLGSGTTVLAAERSGRCAAGIELDPLYVDTAIRRWQSATGKTATLDDDGRTFDEISEERLVPKSEDAQ